MNRFDQRQVPPTGDRRDSQLRPAEAQAHSKPTRPKVSQKDRVKRFLERGWTCGIVFLDPPDNGPPILRYTARIGEVRAEGIYVDRRPCQHPWHDHDAPMWEWKINEGGTLPGVGR